MTWNKISVLLTLLGLIAIEGCFVRTHRPEHRRAYGSRRHVVVVHDHDNDRHHDEHWRRR